MKKKNKILCSIIIVIILAIANCMLISTMKNKQKEDENSQPSPNIVEEHVTHYRQDDGTLITVKDGEEDESKEEPKPQETEESSEIVDIYAKWAVIDYTKATVDEHEHDDHEYLYQMLLYAEIENGFSFDMQNLVVNGINYYNNNYDIDKQFCDGNFRIIGDTDTIDRYIVTITCSEEFTIDDIKLVLYNNNNDDFSENAKSAIDVIDISEMNLHQTNASTTHFIELNGHYYLWAQNDGRIYPTAKNENEYCVGITESSITWMSDGASIEELFTEIVNNAKWSNSVDGELFDSEYATLTLEKDDENGFYLMKTARTDVDDATSNPSYIAYTKEGYGTIYIVIV